MIWKCVASLASAAKFLTLVLLLSASSALVSFFVVHQMGRADRADEVIDLAALHRGRVLRNFSNELVTHCNAYARRIPEGSVGLTPANRRWVAREFRRDVQFLEQRMNDTILGESAVYPQLQAAASRCATMARNPEDTILRSSTLRQVAQTADAVETYIGRLTGASRIGPPPVPVAFGQSAR